MEIKHINAEVTRGCNLKCDYCFNSSGKRMPNELDLLEWERVIDLGKSKGARSTLFTGGEVMTRKDSPKIIEYSLEQGLETNILTNGYGLKNLTRDFIMDLSRVQISLDSASPYTHDSRRGDKSWKIAREAIEFARSNNVPVEISTTISEDRIDEIEGLAGIAYATTSKLLIRPMQELGRAVNFRSKNLNEYLTDIKNRISDRFGNIFVDDFAMYVPIMGMKHDKIALDQGYVTILPDGLVRGTNQKFFQLAA